MRKLRILAFANIKKNRSSSFILAVMFFIAALLLNIGLLVLINYGHHFKNLTRELDSSDCYFLIPDDIYTDDVKPFLTDNSHIKEMEEHKIIFFDAKIKFQQKLNEYAVLFINKDESRTISKWTYIDKHLDPEVMGIYIPIIFKTVSGYQLNDMITFHYINEETKQPGELSLQIKGYVEDIFFTSLNLTFVSFYVPEDTFRYVEDTLENCAVPTRLLFANIDDINNAPRIIDDIYDYLETNRPELLTINNQRLLQTMDLQLVEIARCLMASMVSALMVLFSVIVVVVCLLAVRFRIVNSIEEDMMKIGSLGAAGYRSREIILSILFQFLIIAGIGAILGIAMSYPALPVISDVFEQQSGLKWEQGFDITITLITLILLLGIVSAVSFFAAKKINRLSIINALTGKKSIKDYQKNHLPLEKAKGNIALVLAFKSILNNMKQNIMITIILLSISFFGAFGIIMFYNTTINTQAFAEVPGIELSNVIAILNPDTQSETVDIINGLDGVRKTVFIDQKKIKLDGISVVAYIMEDFSFKETKKVFKGHYPKSTGEIALAAILADRLEKDLGDTVVLKTGENEEQFTIVGISSGASMGGLNISILESDYRRLNSNFQKSFLNIYLYKNTTTSKDFIAYLDTILNEEQLIFTYDNDQNMEEGMAVYLNIVVVMGAVMLFITLLVVALVLYFIISSSIIKRKKELGIQRALGFTTFQLMHQITIAFLLPTLIGVIIGSMVGLYATNPLLALVMRKMGVYDPGFVISRLWIFTFSIGIIIFTYTLSLLITWRVRKISAYALITE